MTAFWYHLRLQLSTGTLAVLVLPLAAGVITYGQPDPLPFAELFWPVGAPVLMAALISREWEGGTAEVLFARPASRGALLAGRVLVAATLMLSVCLVGWGTQAALGEPVGLGAALKAVMPGALALGSVGLFTATITKNSAAGYLVPLAWWLIDWLTAGGYTGRFYLITDQKAYLYGLAGVALLATWAAMVRRDR
ncbi:MAG TPA: ABC transporter permease subunit [Symbiobacteriaceae bacterium]|nr:ABC transporter permease subunit [Symbiobacteriaceae bacterium]